MKNFIHSSIFPFYLGLHYFCKNIFIKQALVILLTESVVTLKISACKFYQDFVFFPIPKQTLPLFSRKKKIVFIIYVCTFIAFLQLAPKRIIPPSLFNSHNKTHNSMWFFDYNRNLEPFFFKLILSVRDTFIIIYRTDLHQMLLMLLTKNCCGRKAQDCNDRIDLSGMLLASWRLLTF